MLIDLLRSKSVGEEAQTSVLSIGPPASPSQINRARAQLPDAVFREIAPLLEFTGGLELHDASTDPSGEYIIGMELLEFHPRIWRSSYPIAVEFGIREELLYWDLCSEHRGEVYFVNHNGPLHCLAFAGLHDALSFFLDRPAIVAWRELLSQPTARPSWPLVSEFVADSDDLRAFLRRFPPFYTVHDLRTAAVGDAFPYNASGPDGITRWRTERLFVQRQPKNWFESIQWWWNPNAAKRDLSLPKTKTDADSDRDRQA